MIKVIGIAALILSSFAVQARDYEIDTCGEVNIFTKMQVREILKFQHVPPMQDLMDQVVTARIVDGKALKKGQPGYHVQQTLYFLQENAEAYGAKLERYRGQFGNTETTATLVAVDMGTLCFEKLSL